jgi:glycosyltransferase involved in cell wall biosynthesis
MRLLFVAHGHPALATGGGELAAWRLFQHFSSLYGELNCGFLAAASQELMPFGCELMGLGPRQWLMPAAPFSTTLIHDTCIDLREQSTLHQALVSLQPDIIHLHHYLHVGVDLLHALKRWFPAAKVCLTLHEYWGPCPYEGRLLRRSGDLCQGGSIDECTSCVGEEYREQLSIRRLRLRRFFDTIDHFIAPSFFLKCQYLHWGLDARRISVIENLPAHQQVQLCQATRSSSRGRGSFDLVIGFFGQINQWKGIDLIIKSLIWLSWERPDLRIQLQIHGLSSSQFSSEGAHGNDYLGRCFSLSRLLDHGKIAVCGRYREVDLQERINGVDAVVMGSIWYENSPMVIQESYLYGRPVVAPRLGGMAEKVTHRQSGLLFTQGSPRSLSQALSELADDHDLIRYLSEGATKKSLKLLNTARLHELLYTNLI